MNYFKTNIMNLFFAVLLLACATETTDTKAVSKDDDKSANIISVQVSGSENSYTFKVGIKSPDTGCGQYANWWEVLSEDGKLIYRRILGHSHVSEQPFIRSGGPVDIGEGQVVWIRAHMNNSGYGGEVFKGTVEEGFVKVDSDTSFPKEIETESPQSGGCAF